MDILISYFVTFMASFVVVWWVVFFILLPIGANGHSQKQQGEGADRQYVRGKLLLTTLIALPLTALLYWLFATGVVSVRGLVGA